MVEARTNAPEEHFPHPPLENRWQDFEDNLFNHEWRVGNIQRVKVVYIHGMGAFFGIPRKTGRDWQFDHGRHIAETLVNDWESRDPVLVGIGLGHDFFEDTSAFWPPIPTNSGLVLPYSKKREFGLVAMKRVFGIEVARGISTLSRPEVDGIEIFSKEQAEEMFVEQIAGANDVRVLVAKLEDNIENLANPFDPVAHERKKEEIKHFFLPLYDRLLTRRYKLSVAENRLNKLHALLED